jgi:hypothetical protein
MSRSIAERCASSHRVATCRAALIEGEKSGKPKRFRRERVQAQTPPSAWLNSGSPLPLKRDLEGIWRYTRDQSPHTCGADLAVAAARLDYRTKGGDHDRLFLCSDSGLPNP